LQISHSHERRFGETTAIIDRCILETAIKLRWLCRDPSEDKFTRYLANGLKTEIEFRELIERNVSINSGVATPLEEKMLLSIGNQIREAGLTAVEIANAKKLPNLDSMTDATGYDRLFCIATQKMGSHHVHGNWPSLLFHYLREYEDGRRYKFGPRDHDCDTHINQFVVIPRVILHALSAYAEYFFDAQEAARYLDRCEAIEREIMKIYEKACENPDGPEVNWG
jgi:hypothetical protein